MHLSRLLLAVVAIGATTGFAAAQSSSMMSASHMSGSVTIPLAEQNKSGEHGTATLTQKGSNLIVVINLKNGVGLQPAHIHPGTCASLNPKPVFPLNNVINGRSTTVLHNVSLAALAGKDAINVHKSTTDLKTYVACGNIRK